MRQIESDNLRRPDATAAASGGMPAPDRLLESAMAFWRSAMLVSAHELGLFTELAMGPRDAGTIQRRLGLRPDATADFLDALVALGFVKRHGEYFGNTRDANLYLDPARPAYIGHWIAMAGAAMRELADLTSRLRSCGGNEKECPSMADRMWADIAEILRGASAPDGA